MKKSFDYRTVATVVSDILFDDLDRMKELIAHMTGQEITYENADSLMRVCRTYFMAQYPALEQMNFKTITPNYYDCYVADFNDILGNEVAVGEGVAALRKAH